MAGEGKFGVNAESIYVDTPEGVMTLLDYLQHNSAGDADWGSLNGKPDVFPPEDHEHAAGDVTSGTFAADRIPSLPQSKVTGLAAALDDKATAGALAELASRVSDVETRLGDLEPDEG